MAVSVLSSALDREALDIFIEEIGIDGVRDTLDVFLVETVERLALLRRLSCANDRIRIETEAHTLKGSSGTFALTQVSTLAKTLQHCAHQITADGYRDLLDRLDAAFVAARAEVEAAMAQSMAAAFSA